MTSKLDPQELERLSKAATQGVITILPGANSHCFDGRLMLGNKCIAFVEGDQTQDEDGEYQIVLDPEALLIVELWNAYRTGQLVPAMPSGDVVEAVARAIYDAEDSQSGDHVGTVIYNSEHLFAEVRDGETEVDATKRTAMQVCRDAARAAITTYEAVSGVAKMREVLEPAFVTSETEGIFNTDKVQYKLVFKFRSLAELDAAHSAWIYRKGDGQCAD